MIAVVTGGARGLGEAFSKALAAAGHKVHIVARSSKEFAADVTDERAVRVAFEKIGAVDVLVNNAGVLGPIGPFAESKFEDWWRTIDVNTRGALLCTHAVLPGMIERRRGRVINIVTGSFSPPYLSAYVSSKTALIRATECIAAEVKSSGVSLFSVAPGTVRTDMTNHSLTSPEGQRWIPWFKRIFDEGLDLPPERPAAMIAALASGRYDALSGLVLSPFDDLDDLIANRADVDRSKQHTLQMQPRKTPAAIAAIRDSASKRS